MQRVMIIGQPGSGKSTLARAIGARTALPVHHIDKIHWMPGWQERPYDEKTRLCHMVHQDQRWIFEGGHSVTWPDRLARCDTLIWLDVPLVKRMTRVISRRIKYRRDARPDLPENCPERLDLEFIKWIWNTRNSARRKCAQFYAQAQDDRSGRKAAFHLRTDAEVSDFLRGLSATTPKGFNAL